MENRQKIIEGAAALFRTYGIRAVTMDMLASKMAISKRTIYEIFRDKDEILKGVIDWMSQRQREVIYKYLHESENVIEAIFKMLDLMIDHFQNMSPAFKLDMKRLHLRLLDNAEEFRDFPYYSNNAEIILRGIDEGVFRPDIDIEITNKCMLEVARLANDSEIFPPEDFMNRDVIRNFYINYLRGISTQKGLELINRYEKMKE